MYRSEAESVYAARTVDFFRMEESARAHFVACTRRKASPNPVLSSSRDAPGTLRVWLLLAGVAAAAMLGLGAIDFGELTPGRANQPEAFAIAYAVLGVALALGVFSAIRVALVRGRLPYPPGVYVFPIDLVDARTAHLNVIPMKDLKEASVRESAPGRREAVLAFHDGSVFTFPLGKTDEGVDELAQMRDQVQQAVEADDRTMLAQLDCFFTERMGDGWGALRPEGAPLRPRRPIPGLAVAVPILALGLGVLAGKGFAKLRDDASDRAGLRAAKSARNYTLIHDYLEKGGRLADEGDTALFETAKDQVDPARTRQTLEHYLHHGRLHVAEADDLYFANVQKDGSHAAWKAYFDNGKRHLADADEGLFTAAAKADSALDFDLYLKLGTKHVDEVRRKSKPLAELKLVRPNAPPAELRKFLDPGLDPEVHARARAILHERFEGVRRAYDARFTKKTAAVELMGRILHAAESGQPLAVRLKQFPSSDFADAEEAFVKRHQPRGVRALGFFSAPRDAARQSAIARETLTVLGEIFGNNIVDVDATDGAVAAGQPVLNVGCQFAPDTGYSYDLSKGDFMSVTASCNVRLEAPGDPAIAPLGFQVKLVPDRLSGIRFVTADNVYEGMMSPLPERIAQTLKQRLEPNGR